MSVQKYEQEFKSIVYENDWLMKVLRTVRECNLPEWFVGAGVIRSLIWDYLHKYVKRWSYFVNVPKRKEF